jgi:hypothetical protein
MNTIMSIARRTAISTFAACVFATAFSPAAFAEAISDLGTWKLNIAKSSVSHGAMPKSNTLTIKRAWGTNHVTAVSKGIDADGNPTQSNLIIMHNGKVQTPNGDNFSHKHVGYSTEEYTRWRDGKAVQTGSTTRSSDGKTLTLTTRAVDASGQQVRSVLVYERQ